jgi:hypothetical protein
MRKNSFIPRTLYSFINWLTQSICICFYRLMCRF